MQNLLEFLNKYTTLILLFGGIIGYWIKRHYDYIIKKNATKFDLFYENRITSIKDFFSSQMQLESVFTGTYHLLFQKPDKAREFDLLFVPARDKLFVAFSHVQLFVDEKDLAPFNNIIERTNKTINEIISVTTSVDLTGVAPDMQTGAERIKIRNSVVSRLINTRGKNQEDLKLISLQTKIDFAINR